MTNPTPDTARDLGLAILRIMVGLVFVAHGAVKLFVFKPVGLAGFLAKQGFPAPELQAFILIAVELLGGLALAAGFLTRWVSVPLAFTMLVAALAVHAKDGFFLPNGAEYTLTLLAATIALALTGPGAFALDTMREKSSRA
jgi:putative oxidoreductase